jgi:hypothetical protein
MAVMVSQRRNVYLLINQLMWRLINNVMWQCGVMQLSISMANRMCNGINGMQYLA